MADIKIPSFLNYTDCRKNAEKKEEVKAEPKKMSEIEKETIINYAKGLNLDEMTLFLSQVPSDTLLAALSFRLLNTECKLESLQRKVLATLED